MFNVVFIDLAYLQFCVFMRNMYLIEIFTMYMYLHWKAKTLWPFLHFTMMSHGWHKGKVIRWKWYLTAVRIFEESCLCLLLPVMEKAVDLIDFDREQNSMGKQLRTSNSKTVRAVCFQWYIVSTYAKRMNDCETIISSDGFRHQWVTKAKRHRRLSHLAKVKSKPITESSDIPIQYRSYQNKFVAHSSDDTVKCDTKQQISYSCATVNQKSSPITPTLLLYHH